MNAMPANGLKRERKQMTYPFKFPRTTSLASAHQLTQHQTKYAYHISFLTFWKAKNKERRGDKRERERERVRVCVCDRERVGKRLDNA